MKKLLCSLIFLSSIFAQVPQENIQLTGSLINDSRIIQSSYLPNEIIKHNFQVNNKKSPMLGGLMSLIIPGAGEVYAEQYWKAAVFLAVEAAVITTAIIYDKKGDDKTADFENFANQNWSAKRYAEWTLDNLQRLNPELDASNYRDRIINPVDGTVNWSELNNLERAIGGGYSHTLAPYGEQQYYEMIGKYPQFSHGWSDSNPADTDYHILSPFFKSYSTMRGDANDLYGVASTAVIFIYVNHFLSAIDAAWSVANYNNNLAVKLRVEPIHLAGKYDFVPTLNFRLSF
ncbi:MAG: hypothetical protein HXY50_13515 [Ignavibacteriaceae bacterium]|nr:hypothetical protein [Ignavibacteriaceae bacterium]